MTEAALPVRYPVRLDVDYVEQQSRWKALLRLFLALPVLLFLALLSGGNVGGTFGGEVTRRGGEVALAGTSGVIVAIWITIILRQRIPRWLFDFQVWVQRFGLRAIGYLTLLTDEYPAFENDYPIRFDIDFPDRLSRWRVIFWKFLTSVPHFIVLVVLVLTLLVVVPIAWGAILITGRYPQGLHTYVTGVLRWGARVNAYLYSLTDAFPPFSLSADAGPGGRDSYVISSIVGPLLTVALIAGLVVAVIVGGRRETVELSYQDLITGQDIQTGIIINDVAVTLPGAADPISQPYSDFFFPAEGKRLVQFIVIVESDNDRDIRIHEDDFRLKDRDGDWHDPFLMLAGGHTGTVKVKKGEGIPIDLIFELPEDVNPRELEYEIHYGGRVPTRTLVYKFSE